MKTYVQKKVLKYNYLFTALLLFLTIFATLVALEESDFFDNIQITLTYSQLYKACVYSWFESHMLKLLENQFSQLIDLIDWVFGASSASHNAVDQWFPFSADVIRGV